MMNSTWTKESSRWVRQEFAGPVQLDGDRLLPIDDIDREALGGKVLLYPRRDHNGLSACLLLAPPDARVTVNGAPLATGVRALSDRDAIGRPGLPAIYYSSEQLPKVVSYDGERETHCPRCRLALKPGDLAVQCPSCRVWHHEQSGDGRKCWTYEANCSLCEQATDLDHAEYRWSPEML
jgi:hypothetical protein